MSHACGLVNLFEIGPGQIAFSQYATLYGPVGIRWG
jgi:hypothetical protein